MLETLMDRRRKVGDVPGIFGPVENGEAASNQPDRAILNYGSSLVTMVIGVLLALALRSHMLGILRVRILVLLAVIYVVFDAPNMAVPVGTAAGDQLAAVSKSFEPGVRSQVASWA